MPEGKYFLIRSKLNPSLVLDIRGGITEPGTEVITYAAHGGDNQLWFEDHRTGTIRSKKCGLCLDFNDNRLVISPQSDGEPTQQLERCGDHICNRLDGNKVLDIVSNNSESGAECCCWENHGGENQKWTFEHQPPVYFYIESVLSGKVLDIAGGDPSPGTKVILWSRKDEPEDNQLWYEDRNGVIRSKLNDLVLDASQGPLQMDHFQPGEPRQWWLIYGDRILNRHNQEEVLDVAEENTDDGAEVIAYSYHGGDNQHWRVNNAI